MDYPAIWALWALTLATCVLAMWKGDRPERIATIMIVANVTISFVGETRIAGYRGLGTLILDAATAFGFLALILRYGQPWLGVAMLIFSAQFGLHAFYLVTDRSPHDQLHVAINNLNFLGVILCLLFGTVGAIRRRQAARAA